MAEAQQAPVILDDDEEKAQDAVPAETLSETTVAEDVEAGEVVIPSGQTEEEKAAAESGTPRVDIAPIRVKPRPQTGVTDTQVQVQAFPPKVSFKTLEAEAEAAVTESEKPGTTYEGAVAKLEAGESVTFQTTEGSVKYVPEQLQAITNSNALQNTMRRQAALDSSFKSQEQPTEPTILFTDPNRTRPDVGAIDDPDLRESAFDYAENRLRLNDTLKEKKLVDTGNAAVDTVVRQYFVDQYATGDFFESLAQRVAEQGRGAVTLPGYLLDSAASASDALLAMKEKGTPFSDEWNSRREDRELRAKSYLEEIDNFLPAPTAAMAMNQDIRKRINTEFEEGFIDEKQRDALLYETSITGENIEREFITEEKAYELIEFAFTELNGPSQFGVIALENAGISTPLAMLKARKAKAAVAEVRDLRRRYNIPSSVRLEGTPAWVNSQDKVKKVDNNLFQMGLLNERLRKQNTLAKKRVDEVNVKAEGLEKQAQQAFDAKDLQAHATLQREARLLRSEQSNLKRQIRRNSISAAVSPYVVAVARDDLLLSSAAWAGRQIFTGAYGMDGEMAEMAGFFSGLVMGKPTKFLGRKVGDLTKGVIHTTGMRGLMPAVGHKLFNMDSTVDDYLAITGQTASFQSRKAIRRAFKEINKMSPESLREMRKTIQKQLDLQKDIVDAFPEDKREEAAKLFDSAFAELTEMPALIGFYQQGTSTITSKMLRKTGFDGLNNQMEEITRKSKQASEAIKNFENFIATYANPASRTKMNELVQTARSSIANVDAQISLEYSALNNQIDLMLDSVASDSTAQITEQFIRDAIDVKFRIEDKLRIPQQGPLTVGQQRGAEVMRQAKTIASTDSMGVVMAKAFQNRLKQVKSIRDDKLAHQEAIATAAEAIINARYSVLSAEGDLAYNDFRKFMGDRDDIPKVDISKFVDEMLRISEEKDILKFFGPEATFFSGHMGKQSMKMFDSMVERALDDIGEDALAEMVVQLVEQGVDEKFLNDLLQGNKAKFGTFLHKFGNVNVFGNATIEEAEELRRAFKDYGYKVTNPAVSKQAQEFKSDLDDIMREADPEGFEMLEYARERYSSTKDPLRPGNPLQKIKSAQVGEKVDLDSGPFVGLFRNNNDPYGVLSKSGTIIRDMLVSGNISKNTHPLRIEIASLTQLFGSHVGDNGELYFDLDTEKGLEAFETLQMLTSEVLYSSWAEDILKRSVKPGASAGIGRTPVAFSTSVMDNYDDITEKAMQVNVRQDGKDITRPLVSLTELIAEEQRIEKVVAKGGRYHQKGLEARKEIVTTMKRVKGEAIIAQKLEISALEQIKSLTGITSNADFYSQYINGTGSIETVKEIFVTRLRKDPTLKDVDLEALFDEAAYKMAYGALKEIGGIRATRIRRTSEYNELISEGADTKLVEEMTNTLGLAAELQDETTIKNLAKIGIDSEQVKHLENISLYIAGKQAMNIAADASAKGMNANEVLSRAYNISRGMVSPTYVASELAVRIMKKNNADAFLLALQSKEAAKIMEKMMYFPELVRPGEMKTFETLLISFAASDAVRKGQELATVDWLDTTLGVESDENEQ
jgi:hypothetical protein